MANFSNHALFCNNIGSHAADLQCCYINDQDSPACRSIFDDPATFGGACQTRDCIADCSDTSLLYSSLLQNTGYRGNNSAPIRRYSTCINVPTMAQYSAQGLLTANVSAAVAPYVPSNASPEGLKNVTLAVTDCLTSTCKRARSRKGCTDTCASVNLLVNNTTPNLQGVNECLQSLCSGGYKTLPYADADVIGIGVFASYIMQCMFVAILFFGFAIFELIAWRKQRWQRYSSSNHPEKEEDSSPERSRSAPKPTTSSAEAGPDHRKSFKTFALDFHRSQCYFSTTLQIASLAYGIFDTDMLVTFMLLPLATNGVLPVVFTYLLLYHANTGTTQSKHNNGSVLLDITLLTGLTWVLSTLVYWILYHNLIPINKDVGQYHAYQQFMYKLSALPACGGYSALAVCPKNMSLGKDAIYRASHKLRVLTPIIWSFSTLVFVVLLGMQTLPLLRDKLRTRSYEHTLLPQGQPSSQTQAEAATSHDAHASPFRRILYSPAPYWLASLCFLAGIGMQLSLLAIGTSLNMMDRNRWSFGQIVAVTIWVPPLIAYLYGELKDVVEDWKEKKRHR